jgi:branched-chain amino acid transport system ATP-binding protein
MPDGGNRLREVIRRLEEARTRAPKGSDATWPGPVADSGSPFPDGGDGEGADRGELLWRPFSPKVLERTRPFRTAPPSRDEFESHLSQFLGTRARRAGPLFRAQGVTVSFGAVTACRDVDLELNDGEIVAVVGPNGAGKTALCDALTGFGPADSGRIYFGDRDVSTLAAHQRAALGLARTFARPALFESMTVAENLMTAQHRRMRGGFFACGLGLALSKHEDRQARGHALEILELLDIDGLADRPVAGLPAGIRRLVEVGRALATEPRLAVLDEPATGLDQAERRDLAERIGMMCDEMGVAVLVTGQDLPFVASLADFVYVLDSGAVVGKGEPPDVAVDTRVQAAYLRFSPSGTGVAQGSGELDLREAAEPPDEDEGG